LGKLRPFFNQFLFKFPKISNKAQKGWDYFFPHTQLGGLKTPKTKGPLKKGRFPKAYWTTTRGISFKKKPLPNTDSSTT